MSIHDGHRERVKNRFRKEGLDHFEEVHVLELLLFYVVPRVDTNPLAHRLLEHFGSLRNVLEATAEELVKVQGVKENIATFLTLISDVTRYYNVRLQKDVTKITTTQQCGEYLKPFFIGKRNEIVYLMCLDSSGKLLSCKSIGEGSVNAAAVSVRKIVEASLAANASSVILAHNHPNGLALPSPEDVQTTQRVAKALNLVDILLADHLVFAQNEYSSMLVSRLYDPSDASFIN